MQHYIFYSRQLYVTQQQETQNALLCCFHCKMFTFYYSAYLTRYCRRDKITGHVACRTYMRREGNN